MICALWGLCDVSMTVTCHGAVPRSSGGSRAAAVRRSGGDASRVRATPPRSPTAARGRGTGRATRLPRNNFSNSISSPRGLESPHEDDQIQNGPRPAAARLRTAVTQRARMARAARVGHALPLARRTARLLACVCGVPAPLNKVAYRTHGHATRSWWRIDQGLDSRVFPRCFGRWLP